MWKRNSTTAFPSRMFHSIAFIISWVKSLTKFTVPWAAVSERKRSPDGPTESWLGRKNTNRATVRSCNLPSEQPRFSVHLKEDEKLGRFPNRIIIPPRTGFQRWVRGSAGREEGEEDCTKPRTGRCHRPKFGTLSWAQMIRFQFWKRESS